MILADKIIELRKRNGWSQEELADRLDVSRQSVSKWEGAQSIPDMNKILKLSEIFGVSTDILLKDELSLDEVTAVYEDEDYMEVRVSMKEASDYLAFKQKESLKIATGVSLCILSPITMLLLEGAAEAKKISWSAPLCEGIAADSRHIQPVIAGSKVLHLVNAFSVGPCRCNRVSVRVTHGHVEAGGRLFRSVLRR